MDGCSQSRASLPPGSRGPEAFATRLETIRVGYEAMADSIDRALFYGTVHCVALFALLLRSPQRCVRAEVFATKAFLRRRYFLRPKVSRVQ